MATNQEKKRFPMIGEFRRFSLLFCASLVVLVCLAYSPIIHNQFVDYDDNKYVYDTRVLNGLSPEGVRSAFTTPVDGNWIPLTLLSFMTEVELFGSSPAVSHSINVFLHGLNAVLLWLLLRRLTGADAGSAVVAAIFALHPLRVESVAWAAERKDVLSAFFWLLSLHAYTAYTAKRNALRYLLLVLAFSAGLLAKSMLVTLPVILLLLDFWPLRRVDHSSGWKQLILEKVPLLMLSMVIAGITLKVQDLGGALNRHHGTMLYENITNAAVSLVVYLRQFFLPSGLTFFYPASHWEIRQWGAALLLLVLVTVWVFRRLHRPYLVFGWLWYLITMLPVIGLVRVGAHAHADRYTYIPLIGVTIMIIWALADFCRDHASLRKLAPFGAASAVVLCTLLTYKQVSYWKDSTTLYQRALAVTEGNWVAHNNLAVLYLQAQQLPEAEEHILEALRIQPAYDEALLNLGHLRRIQRRSEEATAAFRQAVEVNPNSRTIYQLGINMITNGDLSGGEEMQRRLVFLDSSSAAALGEMLRYAYSRRR